jgi:hypothetical protein
VRLFYAGGDSLYLDSLYLDLYPDLYPDTIHSMEVPRVPPASAAMCAAAAPMSVARRTSTCTAAGCEGSVRGPCNRCTGALQQVLNYMRACTAAGAASQTRAAPALTAKARPETLTHSYPISVNSVCAPPAPRLRFAAAVAAQTPGCLTIRARTASLA